MPIKPLPHAQLDSGFAGFFRYRYVGDKVVVTSATGAYLILTGEEFTAFATASVAGDSELFSRLRDAGFVRAEADQESAVEKLRRRKAFLDYGPNLHIVVVTLRCNQTCVYCHASRRRLDDVATDMTPATAEKAVDLILSTTSPSVTVEFQGGEPLVNFALVEHLVDYARERNQSVGKQLEFTMVSNLSLMDEAKLAWLVDNRVQICTSIDGPQELHDSQRILAGGSAHADAAHWIKRINQAYSDLDLDPTLYHVEALLTTTRSTLPRWREVVDTYADLGCRALFLRPVDPFGFMSRNPGDLGVEPADFLAFYRRAVDYIIELNLAGVEILERYAAIFLTKILTGQDPNYLDVRSPCGAAIGQVCYNYDGEVFTCDEGRMLHEQGDDSFHIGDVSSTYRELLGHPRVRDIALASNLDGQPDCERCAYNPYCGVCPAHNHRTQGSIFGRMGDSSLCAVHKGIQDYLFTKLGEADAATVEVLTRWTTIRPRTHFLQSGSAPR